jgi:hypothetical protein
MSKARPGCNQFDLYHHAEHWPFTARNIRTISMTYDCFCWQSVVFAAMNCMAWKTSWSQKISMRVDIPTDCLNASDHLQRYCCEQEEGGMKMWGLPISPSTMTRYWQPEHRHRQGQRRCDTEHEQRWSAARAKRSGWLESRSGGKWKWYLQLLSAHIYREYEIHKRYHVEWGSECEIGPCGKGKDHVETEMCRQRKCGRQG